MGEVEVESLKQFRKDARLTGFPESEIVQIVDEIARHPYFGHQFLTLWCRGIPVPLAGYYVRSWKLTPVDGPTLEACTLHLYLGPSLPIYLFNMSSCLEHEVPWKHEQKFLVVTAESMFAALTEVEA
jgi:hypothetical protein